MKIKIALLMDIPDGKLPGFYAQIVKALAAKVQLFDREKEMLIVNTEQEYEAVLTIMEHYKIATEKMELLLLPEGAVVTDLFTDYGFVSRAENSYLYNKLVRIFRFTPDAAGAERAQAVLQMQEHLLARFAENGEDYYAADRQLDELMTGIAKAYKCAVEFVS